MEDLKIDLWKSMFNDSQGSVIVDVRKPDEWATGIIPNSLTIDIMNWHLFLEEIAKLEKNKPYFLYCRSGARSAQAMMMMNQLGFKIVYNLVGGIMAWDGPLSMDYKEKAI